MRIRILMLLCVFSAFFLCGCADVEEEIPVESSVYTYIEPMEKLYVAETTTVSSAVSEASETTTVETTAAETTTAETTAETTVTVTEITEVTTVPPETETTTDTTTETTTEAETTVTTEVTTESEITETSEITTVPETETVTESIDGITTGQLYESDFHADEDYVKIGGRTYTNSNGTVILSNTCSCVEFAFVGTLAEVTLTSDCKDSKARVGIFVNGERTIDTMLTEKKTTLKVFESDVPEKCIVSIVKLSEQSHSYVGVKNIHAVTEYGIIPTPERERKIEFIGDSITCGYGIDAPNEGYDFSTETEDGSKTYAALTGKALDADVNIVAWSGIGAYSCYTSGDEPSQWKLISGIYGNTDTMHTSKKWDFSKWQPDVVVINIGTNDNSWTKGIDSRVDTFGNAYYDLICQVREKNPDAYIICSLGAMGSNLLPEIKEQVAVYSADTGDYRVTTFEFANQNGYKDGYGADYHPSAKTHQKMADKLAPFIAEIMGWN